MPSPIRQLLSQTSYDADGTTTVWDFSFASGYLDKAHVKAFYLDANGVRNDITVTLGMFIGDFQLSITPALAVGNELTIYRDTPKDAPLVNFADKASFTEVSLDLMATQAVFVAAEASDGLATAITSVAEIAAQVELAADFADDAQASAVASAASAASIVGAEVASSASAAAALASQLAAAASALTASNSATTATTQAGIATTGANTAATQAGIATTGANTAATQAGIATIAASTATTQAGIATAKAAEASGYNDAAYAAAVDAQASEDAAAASASTINLPSLVGKLLNFLRVKTDETGYEHRTAAQVRADIGAAKAGADDTITSLTGLTTPLSAAQGGTGTTSGVLQVPKRQTVLGGPVNATTGVADFGGSTGATTVTTSGVSSTVPLVATAANGFSSAGAVNVTGQSTSNLTFTGLSTNGTMYGYVDIASGALTTGTGTLAPVYQQGGTPSTVNGQFTFNIGEMKGYVGNGSAAVQTNRVYMGEFTVAGGVVTAIVWYALRGQYQVTQSTVANSTVYSFNTNLGFKPIQAKLWAIFTTADNGYSIGDRVEVAYYAESVSRGAAIRVNSNTAARVITGAGFSYFNASSGASVNGNWPLASFELNLSRGW